jgi:hypothetical protein
MANKNNLKIEFLSVVEGFLASLTERLLARIIVLENQAMLDNWLLKWFLY